MRLLEEAFFYEQIVIEIVVEVKVDGPRKKTNVNGPNHFSGAGFGKWVILVVGQKGMKVGGPKQFVDNTKEG